jgi:hypothetical protein
LKGIFALNADECRSDGCHLSRQFPKSVGNLIQLAGFVVPPIYGIAIAIRFWLGEEDQLVAAAVVPDGKRVRRKSGPLASRCGFPNDVIASAIQSFPVAIVEDRIEPSRVR